MKQNLKSQTQERFFTRRDFLSTSLKTGAAAFTTSLIPNLNITAQGRYNVLFIMVDDLRPMLGCYGHSEMHTPNIDRLAERGTLFNRAYCQVPLCNPSRTSLLTGLRPSTTNIYTNVGDYRQVLPDVVDVHPYFNSLGYATYIIGKIGHVNTPFASGPSWQALDVADDELSDGMIAKQVENHLTDIADEQFFLAVGFDKPHLPLYAPRKYYELYNSASFELPITSTYPVNSPTLARNNINLLRFFSDIPHGDAPLSEKKTLELIYAYAASISFIDAQVGRIINQLDALNLTEKTVIVFCGDHGFHLGEHGTWRKNTLFDVALRTPLIVSVPGQTYPGTKTDSLVELVDIYPTLCDVCQIPILPELEGISFKPVIEEPSQTWKSATFSQLIRSGVKGNSIRTERFRYTEWGSKGKFGTELYDYYNDPNETINITHLPENAELVEQLRKWLYDGWQEAQPHIHKELLNTPFLTWDINSDGIVDIQDLVIVSNSFGRVNPDNPKVDLNRDGDVNIIDLLILAAHIGKTTNPAAPKKNIMLSDTHIEYVETWLSEAYKVNPGSDVLQYGIANLEALINNVPVNKTTLLPNYPNPFNPETWIPYDLDRDTTVIINIYNLKGETVKEINLGLQSTGTYRTKGRAAYWDGRNSNGEPVSSGIYFYTLQAGQMKATRRMVIRK